MLRQYFFSAICCLISLSVTAQDMAIVTSRQANTLNAETLLVSTARYAYVPGAMVQSTVSVAKLLDNPTGPVRLKVFISDDAVFDFHDYLLDVFAFEAIEKQAPSLKLTFELPAELSEGTYHLIIMAQTEEGVLLNRTETVKIAVTNK